MRCVIDDVDVDLQNLLGEGGEARVYEWKGEAVKIWKKANDPSIMDSERSAVATRLATLPMKMAAFPNFSPAGVVTPTRLAKDAKGIVIGYAMPMVSGLSLRKWSENRQEWNIQKAGLSNLWYAVKGLHQYSMVWGDANDLNVIMAGAEPHVIDADSIQFGKFRCTTFTQRFGDPLLMHGGELVQPHNEGSDWYAWALMAYISMTGISPWDGTPTKNRIGIQAAWDANIKIPKWAVDHKNLSPVAREAFAEIFLGESREAPNLEIFSTARRDCSACGKWVWGPTCACGLTERPVQMGSFYAPRKGRKLVKVWVVDNKIRWLETDGHSTWDNTTMAFRQPNEVVDSFDYERQECIIGDRSVFLRFGSIWSSKLGTPDKRLGQMIKHQSRIWGGQHFGFGLQRLEESWMPIVIDGAVLDSLTGPPIRGRIYDATACTSTSYAWLGIDDGTTKRFECWTRRGEWVGSYPVDSIRGAVAHAEQLFIPLDGEILRLSAAGKKSFPALVHSKQKLIISREGLSVWDENEIRHIKV